MGGESNQDRRISKQMSVSGPVRRIPRESCLYGQVRHQYDTSRKLRGGRRKEKADRRAEPLHHRPKGNNPGNRQQIHVRVVRAVHMESASSTYRSSLPPGL